MNIENIKFNVDGLIPTIIQEASSGEVLMMAYMNKESLEQSLATGRTHFFSRSRQRLWMKGETSGHIQEIQEAYLDCDNDTLLFKVKQTSGACHTGRMSCFFNKIDENQDIQQTGEMVFAPDTVYENAAGILKELYGVVVDRRIHPKEGSYTNYLFEKGIDKILKKVGEETAEVIIAAKNRSADELTYEVSDLFYHLIVLLVEQGVDLDAIFTELKKRR